MFIKRNSFDWIRKIAPLLITALVIAGIVWGAAMTQEQAADQSLRLTEESIRRAAVQCYALEGIYPVNIQYLMDHYGIRPDTSRFIIHYRYIADNLLPEIAVIPIAR